MLHSRSAARRLAAGLRGFSSKKKPDFYKGNSNSAEAAKNPTQKAQAAEGSAATKQQQPTSETQAAPKPAAQAAAGAPKAGAAGGAATKPAAASAPPSAAAAPKPEAPAPPKAATAASGAAAKPAAPAAPASSASEAAAAAKPAAQPAAPQPGAATAAAAKPAEPTAAAKSAATPGAAAPSAAAAAAAPKSAAPAAAAPKPASGPSAAAPGSAAATKPAAGAGAGGSASGGGGGGNGWLLHPAVPVDVRLLFGVLGAGALAYSLSGGGDKPQAPKPAGVEEPDFSMQPEATTPAGPEAAAESVAPAGKPAAPEASEAAPEFAEPEAAPTAAAEAAGGEGQTGQAVAEAEEEPVYVDGSQVLGVIEEVFSQEAVQKLRQLEQQAEAEVAQAAAASQQKVSAAAQEAVAAAQGAAAAAEEVAADVEAESQAQAQAAERVVEEQVAAIQAAVADQAGEAVASAFLQGGAHKKKAEPQAAAAAEPTPAPAAVDEAATAKAQQLLGIGLDVSAAGLIAEAVKAGMGPALDWSDYPQRHRQAEADAVVLSRLLEAAAANVEAQLEAARREAEAGRAEAAAARRQLADQAESFRQVLKEALARAEEQQRQQLLRQAEQLASAHAEFTVRERSERLARLDGVREKVNALEQAFQRRSNEQRSSHTAHQLSVGVFSLLAALAAGQALQQPLAFLRGVAVEDPVVQAALQAVPEEAASSPVPTRAQLSDEFREVERLSRQLSMLPQGQGGMLSLAVAKLAASLKIAERGPLAASMPGDTMDRRLAAAQQLVLDGELLEAAAQLQAAVAGTAAAPVVARWAHAVRVRATAEQTAALLEAHAAAETASLA